MNSKYHQSHRLFTYHALKPVRRVRMAVTRRSMEAPINGCHLGRVMKMWWWISSHLWNQRGYSLGNRRTAGIWLVGWTCRSTMVISSPLARRKDYHPSLMMTQSLTCNSLVLLGLEPWIKSKLRLFPSTAAITFKTSLEFKESNVRIRWLHWRKGKGLFGKN